MNKKENKTTENIAVGISSAAGSLLGSVSANAAINQIKDNKPQADNEIAAQTVENSEEIVVISHTPGNENHEPEIIVDPEPTPIVECMYAGPDPEPEPTDPSNDPILCVYGPPEPEIFTDIDDPIDYIP